jgi:pyruvate, water dikinase
MSTAFTLNFSEIRMTDVAKVGGKNASLGELFNALATKGVGVLDGFAITTNAYWRLLQELGLRNKLETLFSKLDAENLDQLAASGHAARTMILETPLPLNLCSDVVNSYRELMKRLGDETELAVCSSASTEDLP